MGFVKPALAVSFLAGTIAGGTVAQAQDSVAAKVRLSVNDTNAVGAVGDALLSLEEAVRLANGSLSMDKLSPAERTRIAGSPGPKSRDLIELPATAKIRLNQDQTLSPLVGNDGDTIDGKGASLEPEKDGKDIGLQISSSDFALRNFKGRGFATIVNVDFGGRALRNIAFERLHLTGTTFYGALLIIGAASSNGSLHGLTIADSEFKAEQDIKQANLVFIAAAKNPIGGTVDNVELTNLRLVRNTFTGGGLGLYLNGSMGGGRTTNAVTRNAVLMNNLFVGQHDAAINLIGGLPAGGGHHTKVGLENVVASGNIVETPNWGFYMGNELFGGWRDFAPGSMTDSWLRNLVVKNNKITKIAKGSVGHCISLENGADFRGDQASNNVIENVRIIDNEISGCVETAREGRQIQNLGAGIYVNAGRASLGHDNAGGAARNNVIRNIEISRNRIKDSTRGIVVNGGYNRYAGTAPQLSLVTGNSLTGLRITSNQLENNPTGIRVVGGDGVESATVAGNRVDKVVIRGNRISGSAVACEAIENAGSATGNTLRAKCPSHAK